MSTVVHANLMKMRTFHRHAEDDTLAHWETDVWCHDGSVVIAQGDTAEESEALALARADDHHRFLASSARDRLREVISHAPGTEYLSVVDTTYAIKAIAEILLGYEGKT